MNKDTTLSLVRHVLTGVGGYFAAKGWGDNETIQAVIGAVVAVAGFFLFRKDKAEGEPVA